MRDALVYDCPYCFTHYDVWDGTKGDIDDAKYNQFKEIIAKQTVIGRCKACVRQKPDVPTTFEIDGLLTEKDIKERFTVMLQCRDCNKWTQQDIQDPKAPYRRCHNCDHTSFDIQSTKSIRSFNPLTDGKRKPRIK